MTRQRRPWVMPVSILLALVLGLVPLAPVLQPYRPYWLALVVAYWVIDDADRYGLGFAFVVGLLADLAFGGLLGEHALRLVVMAYILQRFRARLRFFPMSQQALAIGGLLLNDRILVTVLHGALQLPPAPAEAWFTPLIGMVLWPLLHLALDGVRQGGWRRP
ncbi:rod shape-determining protein MreD [Lysobacter sp. SG-8]|uniref:Rod shape-determining protein MreD n=1 Tax=Marilutibacter penaei TaxID=2759900 RepID=A0A7W3YDA0_9GAMM|nr:rod shape-determining protein MreD [Lysobacter penaei]MBB1087138.1 rod shape-determining protein MreD [Lysobacter penaei]